MAISFSTVANTSHCKSPADSREPQRFSVCTSQSVQEAPQSLRAAPQTAYCLPFHLFSLKLTTIHFLIKNQNSGVLTAPLELINSVWTTPLIQYLPAARLTQKTLSISVATERVRCDTNCNILKTRWK